MIAMTLMARLGTSRARAMELSHTELALAMGIIGLDVVARLAPHAPNFTPVAASALFAGAVLRSRALALAVPVAAMLATDAVLGGYDWRVMGVVYAALALPARDQVAAHPAAGTGSADRRPRCACRNYRGMGGRAVSSA